VELKASDPDSDRTLGAALGFGAVEAGEIWQRDTYFAVPRGRLKLREQRPGGAELIQYERADEARERESRYRVVPVEDPEALRGALAGALGVDVTVTKRRRLVLWRTVRIHLDEVEGLGTFVELEAVAPPESDLAHEHALIARLRDVLRITDDRVLESGYADLQRRAGPA
jgi:adenylate cyclase class IV